MAAPPASCAVIDKLPLPGEERARLPGQRRARSLHARGPWPCQRKASRPNQDAAAGRLGMPGWGRSSWSRHRGPDTAVARGSPGGRRLSRARWKLVGRRQAGRRAAKATTAGWMARRSRPATRTNARDFCASAGPRRHRRPSLAGSPSACRAAAGGHAALRGARRGRCGSADAGVIFGTGSAPHTGGPL